MTILKSPPSLWITINPSDIHDPIAQVLTGAEINLNSFDRTSGPDASSRLSRIANDPYAAVRFFHFLISIILEEIFGLKHNDRRSSFNRKMGVFGQTEAYIGTVEAQGRGTLHLHMIVWLTGALSSSMMKNLLQSDAFRKRVVQYIATNIQAHHDDLTPEVLSQMPKERNVSYSMPVDPIQDKKGNARDQQLKQLVRAVQIHKCSPACHKLVQGRIVCKRGAPFARAEHAWVDSEGNWGVQRTIGTLKTLYIFLEY